MKKIFSILFLCYLLFTYIFTNDTNPIQFSLFGTPDIQITIPKSSNIKGLELGLSSYLNNLQGLQFNFFYSTTKNITGIQLSLVNIAFNNFLGVNFGFVNYSLNATGIQFGVINFTKSVKGLQYGFINYTEKINGLQLGFINYGKSTENFALQLSFINILENSSLFSVLPFINLKF